VQWTLHSNGSSSIVELLLGHIRDQKRQPSQKPRATGFVLIPPN
jgi:hypothetical protein